MRIDPNTLSILSTLAYPNAFQVQITDQLDRGTYAKVNKTLEALGGKWSRKERAHVFGSDARVRIDHAITTGEVETGQDVGWFPTPRPIAERLVALVGVQPGDRVLEPSAGEGAIVRAVLAKDRVHVIAIERDLIRRAALQRLAFSYANRLRVHTINDFMEYVPGINSWDRYDRVVMNPPFCKVGKGDHLDHVKHAYMMLQPGGVLVSVLPSSVEFRRDRRYTEFRQWVLDNGTIEHLPEGSFKSSGTGVNTCVIRMER